MPVPTSEELFIRALPTFDLRDDFVHVAYPGLRRLILPIDVFRRCTAAMLSVVGQHDRVLVERATRVVPFGRREAG